ncbi:MAG: hypothetical protein LBB55_07285 [Zoogloeaceae bacterium]|nr:hypothetical protein [Zoogloeaceae bacterium]
MRLSSLPRPLALPPTGWTLAGLLAFYVLAGLFGHDPWANEDVVHLAVARDFLDPGHGLGLSLAGRPFLAAPLYYWSAALTEMAFAWCMPTHDALRFASGLWTALSLAALYYAGREMFGQLAAAATPLLMAGSFGLIVHAHEAQPMLVLLAAISFWLLAVVLLPRKPKTAASLLCLSLSLAALGAGLAGWLILLLALFLPLFLPFAFSATLRQKAVFVLWAVAGNLLVLAAIGGLLHLAAPDWLSAWLSREMALFSGDWRYPRDLLELCRLLPWFSWPLWPLAGWTLWRNRRAWRRMEILLPLGLFLLLFLLMPAFFAVRKSSAILLLPPLALLATPGGLTLRRGAANAFDWFSGMVFSIFAILLWTGWSAMIFGYPARLARRAVELEPGFVGRFDPWFFVLALLVTLWWIWLALAMPRSPYRALTRWSIGLAVGWLLAVSLWLPWIDYGKSYRGTAAMLVRHLPRDDARREENCIAAWQLSEAQIAAFAYFERLRLTPLREGGHCRWLLVEGRSRSELTPPDAGWQLVWEGNRPSDRRTRFSLYRREEAAD